MLELHNVTIGEQISALSLTVDDGRLMCLSNPKGWRATPLLRAILGMTAVDAGHISIDGELLTPLSAPYFRRDIGYVPTLWDAIYGYDSVGETAEQLFGLKANRDVRHRARTDDGRRWLQLSPTERYMQLAEYAAMLDKRLLLVDEPPAPLSATAATALVELLEQIARRGTSVLAVGNYFALTTVSSPLIQTAQL